LPLVDHMHGEHLQRPAANDGEPPYFTSRRFMTVVPVGSMVGSLAGSCTAAPWST
jgi:hypothetical protein